MNLDRPIWCAKCSLRIAPYDARTVYQRVEYHQTCFVKLINEQADVERARQLKRAKTQSNQYSRSR